MPTKSETKEFNRLDEIHGNLNEKFNAAVEADNFEMMKKYDQKIGKIWDAKIALVSKFEQTPSIAADLKWMKNQRKYWA